MKTSSLRLVVVLGGVALVAVVVDDGDLEVGEALAHPSGREPPQAVRRDTVLGVGGEFRLLEALEGDVDGG